MSDWVENNNGNHVLVEGGELVATVFWRRESFRSDAGWAIVVNQPDGQPIFFANVFEDPDSAMGYFDSVGTEDTRLWSSPRPQPADWQATKKGEGFWRNSSLLGGVVSVKRAKSGSWFASVMGEQMLAYAHTCKPAWFHSAGEAMAAVSQFEDDRRNGHASHYAMKQRDDI